MTREEELWYGGGDGVRLTPHSIRRHGVWILYLLNV